GTEFDTELNLNQLLEIDDYFKMVRKKYAQFESEARDIDPRVQLYQVPGGMISNLFNQLKEQNALDKIDAVHREIPKVRKDLGYPPLVTPTSQIVGTQAVINVLTGERYKTITNEVKLYCQGKYGSAPGKINPSLRKKAIGQTAIIDVRPADLLPQEVECLRQEIGDVAFCDEDVLIYAMFPEIGRQFLEQRNSNSLVPERLLQETTSNPNESLSEIDLTLHGEHYHVKIAGFGTLEHGDQSCFLWVDGVPEEVVMHRSQKDPSPDDATKTLSKPGDIKVAMPGTIIQIPVSLGDKVQKGQPVLVIEAMKMETEIQAAGNGIITEILCRKGDKVLAEQILLRMDFN
ncbi:MAG: pyruvate carboxylase subunit B, partial [bacterium]|nr:pyruvate carboxylase subunit B [bacterium]